MTPARIAAGLFGLALATLLGGALLYLSRFWTWRLWSADGLFGIETLRRDGDLLRSALRDAANGVGVGALNAFDILLWGLVVFAVLSLLQWLWSAVRKRIAPGGH